MAIFMEDSKYFNINDIDINRIRVSEVRVFIKKKIVQVLHIL